MNKKQESKPNKYDLPFQYPIMENPFKDKKFSLLFAADNGIVVLLKDKAGKLYSVERGLFNHWEIKALQ